MQRFFFNVRENGALLQDHEGVACVDADQAIVGARAAMRDFANDIEVVVMPWPVSLEVTDERGNVIATVSAHEYRREAEGSRHLSFHQNHHWLKTTG